MADEQQERGMSFVTVAVIALLVCAALVGVAVFFLQPTSQLPFNYGGF